jgi:hypothetical protein
MSFRYFVGSLIILTGVAALIAAEPLTSKSTPVPGHFADDAADKLTPDLASKECCEGQFATAKNCKSEESRIQFQILMLQMSSDYLGDKFSDLITTSGGLADSSFSIDRSPLETKAALRVLTPKQLNALLDYVTTDRSAIITQLPRLTGENGLVANCEVGEMKEFLTGLTVEDQKGQAVLAPKKEVVFLGKQVKIIGTLTADKQSVRMTVKGKLADLEGKPKTLPVELKLAVAEQTSTTHVIQRPVINRVDFALDTVVPNDKTVLLPLKQVEANAPRRFLLVTPHIVRPEPVARDVVVVPFCPEECDAKGEAKCDACPANCQQAKAVLRTSSSEATTLEDIVKMSEAGVSDQVIANQIWITDSNLTLSTQDIIFLKKKNVTNEVIQAIQERSMEILQQSMVPTAPQSVSR